MSTYPEAREQATDRRQWADAYAAICAEEVLAGRGERAEECARRYRDLKALGTEFAQQARDLRRVPS